MQRKVLIPVTAVVGFFAGISLSQGEFAPAIAALAAIAAGWIFTAITTAG